MNEPAGTSTPFRGVERVPAGASLQIDLPALTLSVQPLFPSIEAPTGRVGALPDLAAEYREVLAAAVR